MNFSGYNSILPSNSNPTLSGITNTATDPVMYSFMTHQLGSPSGGPTPTCGPGAIGWGQTVLLGVTENRSLGAHLANYGIREGSTAAASTRTRAATRTRSTRTGHRDAGRSVPDGARPVRPAAAGATGARERKRSPATCPSGSTRRSPTTAPSTTRTSSYYSGDHQGAAERTVEAAIRGAGHVPGSQDVINAFANSDAGDMTSGIQYKRPGRRRVRRPAARRRRCCDAWRQAGRAMTRHPAFGLRFTRMCMCGQADQGGSDRLHALDRQGGRGRVGGRAHDLLLRRRRPRGRQAAGGPSGPRATRSGALLRRATVPQAVPFTALRLGERSDRDGDRGGRPSGTGAAIRAAVESARPRPVGDQPGRDRRLRRGLPELLHDPRRVRAAGLRGRVHPVRELLLR